MRNDQRGLSLIETMVALAILGGAVVAAATYISRVTETRATRSIQLMFRFIAIQTTQMVILERGLFPPISSASPVYYVGCLGKTGALVENSKGSRGFIYTKDTLSPQKPSGLCPQGAIYESRFNWVTPPAGEKFRKVEISVFNLKRRTQDNLTTRKFEISIE